MEIDKTRLRNSILEDRNHLLSSFRRYASEMITERLIRLVELEQCEHLHIYYPILSKNEIDTRQLINIFLHGGRTVILPKIVAGPSADMTHHKIESLESLHQGKWEVMEPESDEIFPLEKIETIIVPMVAADTKMNRLGYGKGYYDRFLKEFPDIPKIGLCYDQHVYEEIPTTEHDVKLNKIVTEKQIIE